MRHPGAVPGVDGSLTHRRVWAELGDGVPDGMYVNALGAIWCADVPNNHCVRVREGGEVLQTVQTDRNCFCLHARREERQHLIRAGRRLAGRDGPDQTAVGPGVDRTGAGRGSPLTLQEPSADFLRIAVQPVTRIGLMVHRNGASTWSNETACGAGSEG